MSRIPYDVRLSDIKVDVKSINLNHFYSEVAQELGIKRLSSLELGVIERTHHVDRTRTVTTTQIAAGHEYGNSFTPPRPFLSTSANAFVNGDFSKDVKQEYTYLGAFLKRLARKLYTTVIDCFTNGGDGRFVRFLPLKDSYKKRTGRVDPPLLDTGKLLGSVYVKYEGYTISGKTAGGMIATREVLWDESDTKEGLKKVRRVNTQTEKKISAEETRKKEEQKARLAAKKQMDFEIGKRREAYIRTWGMKQYQKNKDVIEENWRRIIDAEMEKRTKK